MDKSPQVATTGWEAVSYTHLNQTQAETRNLAAMINDWNPVVFAELHGFMTQFLVEPCTPPHEPNMEYDLLVKNFMLGAEAYGTAALGTISNEFEDTKFWSYYTPLRDDYDPKTTTCLLYTSRPYLDRRQGIKGVLLCCAIK